MNLAGSPRLICAGVTLCALALCASLASAPAASEEARRARSQAADAFFTNAVLHVLKIDVPRDSSRSLRRQPRTYVKATLREGAGFPRDIMVRLKGGAGSFRHLDDKPGLTVKVEDRDTPFHGLRKFHLNNSVQDGTCLSEWVCGQIFRDAGVPAGRAAHAVVELNERRLGMYVLVESINQDFLAQYFQNTDGNVYSLSANADITDQLEVTGGNEDTGGRDLRALASAAREPNLGALVGRLGAVLDLERFLSFMAVEVMLDHWDGYTFNVKNYLVHHNLDEDKMVFIPHDMDQMLRNAARPVMPQTHGVVARAVVRHPELRAQYRARFEQVFTNAFVPEVLHRRIDTCVAALAPGLRDYDPGLAREFVHNAAEFKHRITRRAVDLGRQLKVPHAGPSTLQFVHNTALVKGWRVANIQEHAQQAIVPDPAGKKLLWISAKGPSIASWRSKVMLEPGRYTFEALARSAAVEFRPDDPKGDGAGLRVSGLNRPATERLLGDAPWRKLTLQFDVSPDQPEVDLICELRATKGEVWFAEESLRLVRH